MQSLRNKNFVRFTRVFLIFWLVFMIVSVLAYVPWQFSQVREAKADIAGPNNPGLEESWGGGGAACSDNSDWSGTGSPGGANANDTTYTQITGNRFDNGNESDELMIRDFGFDITSTSIDGFTVEVLGWVTTAGDGADYMSVRLFTSPLNNRGDNKATGSLPTSDPGSTYQSFGGATDDWFPTGSWTEAEVEDANFGVSFCFTAVGNNVNLNIDHVRVTVHYTSSATPTLTQNDFEFWYDNDAANPVEVIGTPDLAENAVLTAIPVHNEAPTSTVEIRIRMNMTVGAANISADDSTLKLQYATSTVSSLACSSESTGNFKDVEANGATAAWTFALSSVTDGTSISPTITGSDVGEYAKSNTNGNPAANNGDDIEYDWHIQKDISANGATYCFRMVRSTGDLDAYNSDSYPRITTAPGSENVLRHGNFFDQVEEKGFYWQ